MNKIQKWFLLIGIWSLTTIINTFIYLDLINYDKPWNRNYVEEGSTPEQIVSWEHEYLGIPPQSMIDWMELIFVPLLVTLVVGLFLFRDPKDSD